MIAITKFLAVGVTLKYNVKHTVPAFVTFPNLYNASDNIGIKKLLSTDGFSSTAFLTSQTVI